MNIEILKDLQEGLVVLLYIVGLCVLGVALHKLIIGKFGSGVPRKPRPEPKPILGGYQPDELDINGYSARHPPVVKAQQVFDDNEMIKDIDRLSKAKALLKSHMSEKPDRGHLLEYLWRMELIIIEDGIEKIEARLRYIGPKPYSLINQK
jgi:hypothetical protein